MVACSNDCHLRQRVGGNERLENPEDPVKQRRDVNKKLPMLQLEKYGSVAHWFFGVA